MFFAAATSTPIRRTVPVSAGQTLERFLNQSPRSAHPRDCAYTQDEATFTLSLDVPGVSREQLAITIDGALVRVHSKDTAPRSYRVAYELPQEIDAASSRAKLENGVLNLKLAKKAPVRTDCELVIH